MDSVVKALKASQKKHQVVDVRSGDNVKVHQKIREGSKERVQIFEGLVIRTDRKGSHTSSITLRRIASGIGVEKTYLIHSPLIVKVEVTKRSKVRRNYLTYMRARSGKSARLTGTIFDKEAVNKIEDKEAEKLEEKLKAQAEADHAAAAEVKAKEEAETETKVAEAVAAHDKKA
ncbi:MAG: 50S ribosomal protein L19 [bacterium]|nr:50S ribosomal protein L19 [bacterium]